MSGNRITKTLEIWNPRGLIRSVLVEFHVKWYESKRSGGSIVCVRKRSMGKTWIPATISWSMVGGANKEDVDLFSNVLVRAVIMADFLDRIVEQSTDEAEATIRAHFQEEL